MKGVIGFLRVRSSRTKFLSANTVNFIFLAILLAAAVSLVLAGARGQAVPYARTFAKPKGEVEQALKELQAYAGQKLPIVDGFVGTPQYPLERYERAFYQFSIELLPGSSGGTIVQVSAKITAWYADKDPAKSGYQVLPSNGRLELDLLDRIDETFGTKPAPGTPRSLASSGISTPTPKINLGGGINMTPSSGGAPAPPEGSEELNRLRVEREAAEKRMRSLSAEVQGLEDVKKNQAHPLNLVLVKRAGTPVLAQKTDDARVLFKAAANDEFEFLDGDGEWVHVQISGVSRGYIRKSALELPQLIAERLQGAGAWTKPAAFRVARQETSVFPGDWEKLRGKTVKIYTVQPVTQDAKETNARAKLSFAAALFKQDVAPAMGEANAVEGVVVIFDSADGGLAATSREAAEQLSKGEISEENFWKQAFLDPPETFSTKH